VSASPIEVEGVRDCMFAMIVVSQFRFQIKLT